ncbi:nitroreductase/quinone reductase family protein [Nocardia bhagyanarayanae]|uniref:Deazaflavin-dependent oxidoreductase (Nitroreductase family) n=1 Tax=Nocardia bhagyanarayanae TaxID=1215925 RepID=A0A543EX76_9NOCA|nr:nitroreductase/quinone reductase family protein [Nocardia bhagyanarayanae]TQM26198.1 deazaflavin-dependent oxidoreductase (nitroreductase family) [Nocardia bhagyanarayanae]
MAERSDGGPAGLSRTGRFAHFGSTRLTTISKWHGRLHSRLYARFGGTRFGKWLGRPVFQLTVPGRKTGRPRSVVLMYIPDGDDLLVSGSFGGHPKPPNWWGNLLAAGGGQARVGHESWPVTARVVTDDDEYAARWRVMVAHYPDFVTYQALSPRRLPIAVLSRAAE